jgi:hypothetical protein
MMLPKRILFLAVRFAPVLGLLVLLAFGVLVALGVVRDAALEPVAAAWATGLLVLAWLFAHLAWRGHLARRPAGRDSRAGMSFELHHGRGLAGWRERLRRRGRFWHGRSPDGVRPRFD